MNTIIAELEEQVEFWRQRAEELEHAVAGRMWGESVAPLSLYQTRLMRILAKRDTMANALLAVMVLDYPNTSHNAMKSQICMIRTKLPAHIAPPVKFAWSQAYTVPDRAALQSFLITGVLPVEQRRAA